MASVNKIFIAGRIGQDPQSVQVGTDTIARLSVATDDGYRDQNGQKVERTTWHSVTCGGKTADFVLKYLHKGDMVMVEGKVLSRKYQTKDGMGIKAFYVQAQRVESLGSHKQQGLDQGNAQPRQSQQGYAPATGGAYGDDWKY